MAVRLGELLLRVVDVGQPGVGIARIGVELQRLLKRSFSLGILLLLGVQDAQVVLTIAARGDLDGDLVELGDRLAGVLVGGHLGDGEFGDDLVVDGLKLWAATYKKNVIGIVTSLGDLVKDVAGCIKEGFEPQDK